MNTATADTPPDSTRDTATTGANCELLRQLARDVDCLTEGELCLLANVTPSTALTWRKRGIGPAYALVGNRVLYPRAALADFVKQAIRQRRPSCAKDQL